MGVCGELNDQFMDRFAPITQRIGVHASYTKYIFNAPGQSIDTLLIGVPKLLNRSSIIKATGQVTWSRQLSYPPLTQLTQLTQLTISIYNCICMKYTIVSCVSSVSCVSYVSYGSLI